MEHHGCANSSMPYMVLNSLAVHGIKPSTPILSPWDIIALTLTTVSISGRNHHRNSTYSACGSTTLPYSAQREERRGTREKLWKNGKPLTREQNPASSWGSRYIERGNKSVSQFIHPENPREIWDGKCRYSCNPNGSL